MTIQTRWRIACSCFLAGAGLLAWYGADHKFMTETPLVFIAYWGAFVFCVVMAIVLVFVDLRFVRLHYVLAKRELYRQTLGDEEFRKALIEAQKDKGDERTITKNAEG
jgi:membrane protein implicated in regulation of membrane protease activity